MSNVTQPITVPTTVDTAGAIIDVSNAKAENRTYHYKGAAREIIHVQGAMANAAGSMVRIGSITTDADGFGSLTITDRSLYTRAYLKSGAGGGDLRVAYAEETTTAGPAGAPSLGSTTLTGSASVTDATATQILAFTPGGDGAFTVKGVLTACQETSELSYSAEFLATFKKTGGTASAEAISITENTASLNPGTITATVSAGVCKINFVGIAATNIHAAANGVLQTVDAF